ncbi:DeoR family transcriptional regulator [Vibrio sp. HA2012]|uniref:DeoR/GlpR family DNA-binding transcription regulator n=1 Tax=Vibrio sp. HA2012 TaxID=1971595 RepID=UPI000C2C6292|nr:DNA-binding transcriptional regulator YciT [Vibrio sp. HA2012]PJC87159.1 DeoR family transcriptional regulator [Vibrio sp. HA2012]
MNARQTQIVDLVNQQKRVMVSELSVHTGVSEVTIRQDLNFLEKEGHLKRVHGAAVSLQSDDVSDRLEVQFDAKQKLAEQAAKLIGNGETVLIEGGSANALLARILANRGDITIITPSVYISHLIRNTQANVIILGGMYQHQSESLVGPLTRLCIENVHFSTAFLGIDGYHRDTGFTSRDMMRADIAAAILAKNKRNIVLSDASKFGQIYSTSIGTIEQFSTLITNEWAPREDIDWLRAKGMEVILN